MERNLLRGYPVRLRGRGLSERTCQRFKIYKDDEKLRFHYCDSTGAVIAAKVRTKDKDFYVEGNLDGSFFGQHLCPSSGKRIVITEGELDAASCLEVAPTWPVVSLPTGAAGAKRSIQKNLEFLQGYDEIVLFFDNDDPGRKAAADAASVLPPGKAKLCILNDYKDASECLQAGDTKALVRAIWDTKEYRPDGIVDGKTLKNLVTAPNPPNDHDYPYDGLNKLLHGIRYGELTTITAGSGIGKSSFCRELATSLLQKGERVGYLALEESNRRTLLGLMSSASGKSLHLGEHDTETLATTYDNTVANWDLFLFDGFGSYDPDIIYNRIEYLATGLETRVVFLDHLSILLSGLEGDERRMIDTTMTKLRSLVERTGIALFLVSHLKRTQSDQNHEEGARVTLGQLRGSAAIAQLSDSVIALERNQQDGSQHSDTTVRVLKNRYSGETGIACRLEYNLDKCKFTENEAQPFVQFDATTDF
jgi:twinkle protein